MKIKIYSTPSHIKERTYWSVKTPYNIVHFTTNKGAVEYAKKFLIRYRKEHGGYSMVTRISINLLNVADMCFVSKLKRTKCKGITLKQYGYLKGIYERQQREW